MRENPDTSLALLQLLADEPRYPSRLTIRHLVDDLGISLDEAELHLKCCVDYGLVDVGDQRTILGLTGQGQEFVRNADAAEGKWWRKGKELCAKAGVDASTSTLAQAMTSLIQAALQSGG